MDTREQIQIAIKATVEILTEFGSGSGFIIHPGGLVVTGRHVVNNPDGRSLRKVKVRIFPASDQEQILNGIVFRSHTALDFALIWLLAEGPFPSIPIGNPQKLLHTDTVYAIGAPIGIANTVSRGIISNPRARIRNIEWLQTDAAIDRGNSGGPLVNEMGEAVGINLWGAGQVDALKFAAPLDYLSADIARALDAGRRECLEASYCPACGYAEFLKPAWFCRNCGFDIQGYYSDHAQLTTDMPPEVKDLMDEVLTMYGIGSLENAQDTRYEQFPYQEIPGVIGLVFFEDGKVIQVIHMPILKTIDFTIPEEILRVLPLPAGLPGARYISHGQAVHLIHCSQDNNLTPEQYSAWIMQILRIVDDAHYRVVESLDEIAHSAQKLSKGPPPQMPNVKLTPRQLEQLQQRLASCDTHSREIFCYLMEQWQQSGYMIDTKNVGIGLRIPFGQDTLNLLRMMADEGSGNAYIWITWVDQLSQHKAIPPQEIVRFQETVSSLVTLQHSEYSTRLDIDQAFTRETAQKLVQAFIRLAKSVQQDLAVVYKGTTPNNIAEVLKSCPPRIRKLFSILIEGWKQAGGRVNCSQPNGRIYLKLQTGKHAGDETGSQPARFNLIALAGPLADKGARIEITWNLAQGEHASLAMIPQQVAQFEAAAARLPGFTQKGRIARLPMVDNFQPRHAQALLKALLDLKLAEEESRVKPA